MPFEFPYLTIAKNELAQVLYYLIPQVIIMVKKISGFSTCSSARSKSITDGCWIAQKQFSASAVKTLSSACRPSQLRICTATTGIKSFRKGPIMDFSHSRHKKVILMVLVFVAGILMLPLHVAAELDILKNFSFDDCDPFEARALIVSVNGKKAQLVAAEQVIYVVDLNFGDQHLITELTDPQGNRMDFSAFSRGQWVYVKGFKHINGGVVASLIQRIDPPERKKPEVPKISKNSQRYKRIKRQVSAFKN